MWAAGHAAGASATQLLCCCLLFTPCTVARHPSFLPFASFTYKASLRVRTIPAITFLACAAYLPLLSATALSFACQRTLCFPCGMNTLRFTSLLLSAWSATCSPPASIAANLSMPADSPCLRYKFGVCTGFAHNGSEWHALVLCGDQISRTCDSEQSGEVHVYSASSNWSHVANWSVPSQHLGTDSLGHVYSATRDAVTVHDASTTGRISATVTRRHRRECDSPVSDGVWRYCYIPDGSQFVSSDGAFMLLVTATSSVSTFVASEGTQAWIHTRGSDGAWTPHTQLIPPDLSTLYRYGDVYALSANARVAVIAGVVEGVVNNHEYRRVVLHVFMRAHTDVWVHASSIIPDAPSYANALIVSTRGHVIALWCEHMTSDGVLAFVQVYSREGSTLTWRRTEELTLPPQSDFVVSQLVMNSVGTVIAVVSTLYNDNTPVPLPPDSTNIFVYTCVRDSESSACSWRLHVRIGLQNPDNPPELSVNLAMNDAGSMLLAVWNDGYVHEPVATLYRLHGVPTDEQDVGEDDVLPYAPFLSSVASPSLAFILFVTGACCCPCILQAACNAPSRSSFDSDSRAARRRQMPQERGARAAAAPSDDSEAKAEERASMLADAASYSQRPWVPEPPAMLRWWGVQPRVW